MSPLPDKSGQAGQAGFKATGAKGTEEPIVLTFHVINSCKLAPLVIMMAKAVEATTHHVLSSLEFKQHHVLERRIALRIAYPPDISTTMNKTKMPIFISRRPKLSSRNRSAASS